MEISDVCLSVDYLDLSPIRHVRAYPELEMVIFIAVLSDIG